MRFFLVPDRNSLEHASAVLLARQVLTLRLDDPGHCLTLFKSNREVGLAIALAFLLGRP